MFVCWSRGMRRDIRVACLHEDPRDVDAIHRAEVVLHTSSDVRKRAGGNRARVPTADANSESLKISLKHSVWSSELGATGTWGSAQHPPANGPPQPTSPPHRASGTRARSQNATLLSSMRTYPCSQMHAPITSYALGCVNGEIAWSSCTLVTRPLG